MGARGRASRLVAVMLGVVLLGACSAGSGNGGGTGQSGLSATGTGGAPTAASRPAPKPVTVKEYSASLVKAVGPLESALDRLASAKAYKGLERRVFGVESAATKAAGTLGQVTPPADLAGPNAQLVTALQAFGRASDGLGSEVDGKSLCTGPVVRAGLGDAEATSALRKAMAAVSAKLPGDQPVLKLPNAGRKVGERLPNGTYVRSVYRDGRSELSIDNGGSSDAVVTLSEGRKPAIVVYVRKGKKYTVKGVPDGSYTVFFSGGSSWDESARTFGRRCVFSRFEDPLQFRTTRNAGGIYWQNFRITLNPVFGGNARTQDVDPDDFPDS